MDNVYLIEFGGGEAVKVFTDKKIADKYCEEINKVKSGYFVEEIPINDWDSRERCRDCWRCHINLETGDITHSLANKMMARPRLTSLETSFIPPGKPTMAVIASFVSKEHADEKARKARETFLRKKG